MTGASLGNDLDKQLTEAGVLSRRMPFQVDSTLRKAINAGEVMFIDQHLSETVEQLRNNQLEAARHCCDRGRGDHRARAISCRPPLWATRPASRFRQAGDRRDQPGAQPEPRRAARHLYPDLPADPHTDPAGKGRRPHRQHRDPDPAGEDRRHRHHQPGGLRLHRDAAGR